MLSRTKVAGIGAAVVVVLIAAVAVVLVLVEDGDSAGRRIGGPLAEALDLVPADAADVTFVDRTAVVDTFDLPKIETGASAADVDAFIRAEVDAGQVPLTDLDHYAEPMRNAAFSGFDVDWAVSLGTHDSAGDVYRMRDGLDLDDVAEALTEAGWHSRDVDGGVELSVSPQAADATGLVHGRYPIQQFAHVTLLPSRHLMLASMGSAFGEEVRATLAGRDSVGDARSVAGLVDGDPVAAVMSIQGCADAFGRMSPAQREQVTASSGIDRLGTPQAVAVAITGRTQATASLSFADHDAASADAAARKEYLAHGRSIVTGGPVTDLVDDVQVSVRGNVVDVAFRPHQRPISTALQFVQRGPDGPVACGGRR